MLEREVEKILKTGIEGLGGMCLKWVSPSRRGVPDRIVILPKGRVEFVELKKYGGRLSPLQKRMIAALRDRGVAVYVLTGKKEVLEYLRSKEDEI